MSQADDLYEEFPTRPWLDVSPSLLPRHPSMLGEEENKFLYWYSRNLYDGSGEILDLGGFLGGSATCLARGVRNSKINNPPPIRSFDFFKYDQNFYPKLTVLNGLASGDSTLPAVKALVGKDYKYIDFVSGDICLNTTSYTEKTENNSIDFIFLDFTQNWQHHDAVIKNIYPRLKVGGILAHQDYLYVLCYWLHIYMEKWSEFFRPISRRVGGGTAAFRLVKELPPQATQVRLAEYLSIQEMGSFLENSLMRYPDEPHAGHLACAKVRFLFHTEQYVEARNYGKTMLQRYVNNDGIRYHLELALDECDKFEQMSPSPYSKYFNQPKE